MSAPYPMSALPVMPIDPAWLEQSQAFFHADARLAKARTQILIACWRGVPAATIPKSVSYLMQITCLDQAFIREHWSILTEGMSSTAEGRLSHDGMRSIWEGISSRYSKALEEFCAASVMAQADPEQFALVAVESAKPKARGKTSLPKGFGYQMYPELLAYAHSIGCETDADKAWIMQSYVDYIESRDERAKSWPAHFRLWSRRQIEQFRAVPPSRQPKSSTAVVASGGQRQGSGYGGHGMQATRGEVALERNLGMFASRSGPGEGAGSATPQAPTHAVESVVVDGVQVLNPLSAMLSRAQHPGHGASDGRDGHGGRNPVASQTSGGLGRRAA